MGADYNQVGTELFGGSADFVAGRAHPNHNIGPRDVELRRILS